MIFSHFRLNSGRFPDGLSIPSVVFAEASWYGSIRGGWESNTAGGEESGYSSFGSRWGIKGSSEVSEGLNAVYKFETRISDGGQTTNQLYTGLSGGFGTVTLGKMPNAAHVHAGFVDNSQHYGTSELASKVGDTISYSVDVGAASFQVDAIADSGMKGKDADSAQFGATVRIGDNAKVGFGYISHATMDADTPVYVREKAISGTADDDKVVTGTYTEAVAAVPEAHLDKDNQAQIAGQYSIGGVTLHLGYGERKKDTDSKAAAYMPTGAAADSLGTDGYLKNGLKGGDLLDAKHKTTFFGFAGGLGDTGFAYNFQMRNKKNTMNKVTHSYRDQYDAFKGGGTGSDAYTFVADSGVIGGNTEEGRKAAEDAGLEVRGDNVLPAGKKWDNESDESVVASSVDSDTGHNARGTAKETSKSNPWVFGLSRSLGGGASVILEHKNVDSDAEKNTTGLFLVVNF